MGFPPPKVFELDFRDGRREVPEYLYPVLARLETYTMTYEEAIRAGNRLMERDFVSDVLHKVRSNHLTGRPF